MTKTFLPAGDQRVGKGPAWDIAVLAGRFPTQGQAPVSYDRARSLEASCNFLQHEARQKHASGQWTHGSGSSVGRRQWAGDRPLRSNPSDQRVRFVSDV